MSSIKDFISNSQIFSSGSADAIFDKFSESEESL